MNEFETRLLNDEVQTTASSSGPFPYDGRGVPTMPPPAVPPQQHVITDDAVKLEGIPANNRIFVDGRAHEVSGVYLRAELRKSPVLEKVK